MIGLSISEAALKIGEIVEIRGFVHKIRNQKDMLFIVLRDRTGYMQITIDKNINENLSKSILHDINRESVIAIKGKIISNEIVKLGGVELIPFEYTVLSQSEEKLPIDPWAKKQATIDKRLDWRYLDLRNDKRRLIFEIQTAAEKAMREWWYENDYIEIHSPKLLGAPSESGAELFELEYFDKKAYLAQSPQFYKQMAMAAGFEKVFEIGPVFRANPSFTTRHDTEFTSVDVEISWISSHHDLMSVEEKWIVYVFTQIYNQFYDKIKDLYGVSVSIPSLPFPKLTMEEAQNILRSIEHTPPENTKPGDLDPTGEKLIYKYIKNNTGHDFVFIYDYPYDVRPFYHMKYDNNPSLTKSYDLLYKGLEITTGAQREHKYPILLNQAKEKNIDIQSIQFYLDFFKYGMPPHGGFGFGLTRVIMSMLELPNVREATYLYRGPKRLTP